MDHTMVPDHRIVAAENPLGQVTVQVQLCENHVQKPRCKNKYFVNSSSESIRIVILSLAFIRTSLACYSLLH